MYVQNFRSLGQKLWPLRSGHTYMHTYICTPYIHIPYTYRQKGETGETQGKPSTSWSSIPVSIQYRFVKWHSLVISTGLYRKQVSGKGPGYPLAFQYLVLCFHIFLHSDHENDITAKICCEEKTESQIRIQRSKIRQVMLVFFLPKVFGCPV